jgi:hypothetical protein
MENIKINGRETNPIVSLILFATSIPYLNPILGWLWFGIMIFNYTKFPWYALTLLIIWSFICSKSAGESKQIIKQQISENNGVVTTKHEISMILLNLIQYPTFIAALYALTN